MPRGASIAKVKRALPRSRGVNSRVGEAVTLVLPTETVDIETRFYSYRMRLESVIKLLVYNEILDILLTAVVDISVGISIRRVVCVDYVLYYDCEREAIDRSVLYIILYNRTP